MPTKLAYWIETTTTQYGSDKFGKMHIYVRPVYVRDAVKEATDHAGKDNAKFYNDRLITVLSEGGSPVYYDTVGGSDLEFIWQSNAVTPDDWYGGDFKGDLRTENVGRLAKILKLAGDKFEPTPSDIVRALERMKAVRVRHVDNGYFWVADSAELPAGCKNPQTDNAVA